MQGIGKAAPRLQFVTTGGIFAVVAQQRTRNAAEAAVTFLKGGMIDGRMAVQDVRIQQGGALQTAEVSPVSGEGDV